MRITLILLALSYFSIGCNKKENSAKSSLTFEMKTFRLESAGGCKDDTTACASFTIEYPVVTGLPDAVNDSLKYRMAEAVETGNPENDSLSFEASGRLFIKDFENTKIEFPDGAMGWYYNATVTVNILSDTLISLSASNESFTGGAHGGYGTYYVNINPATGKTLTLNEIFKPGYEKELNKLGEADFRKSLELSDSVSYTDLGFEFPDDQFKLNDNFGFTDKGIQFVFNVYEIGPYVLGAQLVEIPYSEIKNWLK